VKCRREFDQEITFVTAQVESQSSPRVVALHCIPWRMREEVPNESEGVRSRTGQEKYSLEVISRAFKQT